MNPAKYKRGISDGGILFVIFLVLVLLWLGAPADEGAEDDKVLRDEDRSGWNIFGNGSDNDEEGVEDERPAHVSPWEGKISLNRGNSKQERIPDREYIEIRTGRRLEEPVNITGWYLENARGERYLYVSGSATPGVTSRVYIPTASSILLPNVANTATPLLLNPGERAIVITGNPPRRIPFPVTSFRVNKCSGYLEEMDRVEFSPRISRECPLARDYPQVDFLEEKCYDFVRRMSACYTPEKVDEEGEPNENYYDGVRGLSQQCEAFIDNYLNYNSCVALHFGDEDFYEDEWRIFLGQSRELWDEERDAIRLYDSQGRIVDEITWR